MTHAVWMKQTFKVVVEQDEEGWFIASVPALPGVHTQARTEEELKGRIAEAIQLYLEVMGKPPEAIRFIGVEDIKVST